MATTLQSILETLRSANVAAAGEVLTRDRINYGLTDNAAPPYVAITDFESKAQYDVGPGQARRDSTFKLHVFDKSCDDAESLAAALNTLIDNVRTLTPNSMGSFQENYKIVQEELYLFHVEIDYSLQENFR